MSPAHRLAEFARGLFATVAGAGMFLAAVARGADAAPEALAGPSLAGGRACFGHERFYRPAWA